MAKTLSDLKAEIAAAERGSLTDLGKVLRSVADGDVQLSDGDFVTLTLGGTLVTATAAELNILDGATATAAEINAVADVSGRIVAVTDPAGGTLELTVATHGERIVYFDDPDGAIELPNATGSGTRFEIVLAAAATSLTVTVAADTDEEFAGGINGVDDDADAAYAWKAEDDDDTITFNGTATGGKIHDWLRLTDIATGVWLVEGFITQSGGSEATPFSAAISAP